MQVENKKLLLLIIGVAILFPLFLLLSGDIYNSVVPIVDSLGDFSRLPLPISILACFGGILMLIGDYRRALLALTLLGAMLFVMLVSLIFAGVDMEIGRRKVILLLQFLLPVFGLVLGQQIIDRDRVIPHAFLYVLFLVVPMQLVSGWLQGNLTLTHYLYLFSIYSHFQYVPLIFVCAFAYSMTNLWESHKKAFYILMPLMFIYAVASVSFLTIFAYFSFIIVFAYSKQNPIKNNKAMIMVTALIVATVAGLNMHYWHIKYHSAAAGIDSSKYLNKFEVLASGKIPINVEERLDIWSLYISGVTESGRTVLLGHIAPLPREVKSSAHNWYLDMAYNFGLISMLPMLLLIGYTAYLLWQSRETLPRETLWLAIIVFYLVVVDNNFKVTLRQPYPGIFAYFLWGLLLSRLTSNRIENGGRILVHP